MPQEDPDAWWKRLIFSIIGGPSPECLREILYREHAALSLYLGARCESGGEPDPGFVAHRNYIAGEFYRRYPGASLVD